MKTQVLLLSAFTLFAVPAHAQATRTWVSGVGDDANPCSRTAPCKTFAGAISKTASRGVISVLDPGGYGAVTITKPITIDGGGIEGSILAAGTNGVVISLSSFGAGDTVILRNLTIYGTGTGLAGIRVIGAIGGLHVEDCVISDFTGRGIDFSPSSGILHVAGTQIQRTGSAIYVNHTKAMLTDLELSGNVVGIKATTGAWVSARKSVVAGSTYAGVVSEAGSIVDIGESIVSQNVHGLVVASGGEIAAHETTITGNTTIGMANDGTGFLVSTGRNTVLNNVNGAFTAILVLQ